MSQEKAAVEIWEEVGKFHKLTYWNHDSETEKTDDLQQLWEYLKLHTVLHLKVG